MAATPSRRSPRRTPPPPPENPPVQPPQQSSGKPPPLPSGKPPMMPSVQASSTNPPSGVKGSTLANETFSSLLNNLNTVDLSKENPLIGTYLNEIRDSKVLDVASKNPSLKEEYTRIFDEANKKILEPEDVKNFEEFKKLIFHSAVLYNFQKKWLERKEADLKTTQTERDQANQKVITLQSQVISLDNEKTNLSKQLEDKQTELEKAQDDLQTSTDSTKGLDVSLQKASEETEIFRKQLVELEKTWKDKFQLNEKESDDLRKELNQEKKEKDLAIREKEGITKAFEAERAFHQLASRTNYDLQQKIKTYEDGDKSAKALVEANRTISLLKNQLKHDINESATLSREALDAVHVLQDSAITRRTSPQVPGAYSRSQLDALQQALKSSIDSIDAQNASLVRTMEAILSRGASNVQSIRELNRLRTTLAGINGGRIISSQQDGSVTWAFTSTNDAYRVQAALKGLGFETQLTVPISTPKLNTFDDPADLLIQREIAQSETLLRSNAYALLSSQQQQQSASPPIRFTGKETQSQAEDWLIERSTSLFSTSANRSNAVQSIVRLLATFKQGEINVDVNGNSESLSFSGNDRRQRAMDTSMLLKRLGVKHSDPKPVRERGYENIEKEKILIGE